MARPHRCHVRAGDHHEWQVFGDRFYCARCKEPGPEICDALLDLWDARTLGKRVPIDERIDLLRALADRANMVLDECEKHAAELEAELAANRVWHGPTR